jgi:adenosylmethionine-8-amino-7-oxononanoate aminotransferase
MARRQLYAPIFKEGPKIETHYCYRCPYGKTYPECDVVCARRLESEIRRIGPQYVAAFVAEPVVGSTVGGLHPPAEYWPIIGRSAALITYLLIAQHEI